MAKRRNTDSDAEASSDPGAVERAARDELQSMAAGAAVSTLGASVVDLARSQDKADTPGAKAVVAKELRAGLVELWKQYPAATGKDELDELRNRREQA